jgi:cation diffusion facilitator family transporter
LSRSPPATRIAPIVAERPSSPAAAVSRLEIRAAVASVVVSFLLMALKFVAYWWTGSTAIFSDALESIVNVFASGVAFYALSRAHAPADKEHPYGHGKIEFLSAGFEGGLIVAASIVIIIKAIAELVWRPTEIEQINLGLLLIGVATAVNALLGGYLIRLGRRHGSLTLEADGRHLFSDALTSVAAIAALVVVRTTGWREADPIAALLMGGYIGVMGVGLLRRSAAGLMDEQDAADNRLLERLLGEHVGPTGRAPRICSFHKLRHRHVGRYHWVDFHIMLPGRMTIEQGHDAASEIEGEIERALGEGDATAHIEPCQDATCIRCASHPRPQTARTPGNLEDR